MAEAGTVKFFNSEKGFGFVERKDAPDVFFHKTDLRANGIETVVEGQKITFDVVPGKDGKGPKAANITIGLP